MGLKRHIGFEQAKLASRIEEEFQLEIWGVVEGGHDMDRLNNSVRLSSVDCFMRMYWSRPEDVQRFIDKCNSADE